MIAIPILAEIALILVIIWAFQLLEKNNARKREIISHYEVENTNFKNMLKRIK